MKGKEAVGQQTDTDQRGIPMVTLRPCRQASMLFTSTLAAHLKIGSDNISELARTEKVQSCRSSYMHQQQQGSGLLKQVKSTTARFHQPKKIKKQKASHHPIIFHQNNREGKKTSLFRVHSAFHLGSALLGTVQTTCIYSSVLSTPRKMEETAGGSSCAEQVGHARGASAAHRAIRNPRIIEGKQGQSPCCQVQSYGGIRGLFIACWRTRGFVFPSVLQVAPVLFFFLLRPP
jgi:hypothetical protein